RRKVASTPVFDLSVAERSSPDGRRGEFWLLDAPDWVNVVPVLSTPAGPAFLMVRQYRHGAAMITTEFPAGAVEQGEDPRRAAERELREETGYRAGRLTLLGRVQPNPAFMGNWCSTWLAEDLALEGDVHLDALEALEAVTVPMHEVVARMGSGEYVNSLAVVALSFYQRHGASGT
ncbi:MAG TPA: NUDIX hydrolase, partial [bacterium]|nr:NUDIX hydrolase [bacterium]